MPDNVGGRGFQPPFAGHGEQDVAATKPLDTEMAAVRPTAPSDPQCGLIA